MCIRDSTQTLTAFFRACAILKQRRPFTCIIKGRETDGSAERAQVEVVAQATGFHNYRHVWGTIEAWLLSAEAVVACESNVFVQAMLLGTPAVNVWLPSSWIVGPAFGADDGVPLVPYDEPGRLAAVLDRLLSDQSFRTSVLQRMSAAATTFHVPLDGHSARRCADFVTSRCKPIVRP